MPGTWSDIPFAPRRWPFFYGWVILVATTIGTLASLPGQTMIVGVFTDHLIAALAIDRVRLSTAYMIGTIGSSLLLPLVGRVVDRFGPRAMSVVASVGLGLALVLLAGSDRIAAALPGGPAVAGMVAAALVFLPLRFFGQGCLTLTARVTLSNWFHYRRGLAVGIAGVFISFGFNSGPVMMHNLVELLTWRGAALALAAAIGIGMAVFSWVFYRDTPEACGLVMDGISDPAWQERMRQRQPSIRHEYTRREALRTPTFWAANFALATQALVVTAVTFHIADLGTELTVPESGAYSIFWPMSFYGITANFVAGWVSDRCALKWLFLAQCGAQAVGTLGLMSFGDPLGRGLMIAGYGTSLGIFGCLLTVPWPRFYGRLHLGAISALVTSLIVFASAIGPVIFARAAVLSGSYLPVKVAALVLAIVAMAASLLITNPQAGDRPQNGR